MSHFRLLQLVVFAGVCLLALKGSALIFSGGQVFTGAAQLNAQEAFEQNAESSKVSEETKNTQKQDETRTAAGPLPRDEQKELTTVVYSDRDSKGSASKLDLLESLAVRRKQLNMRETQLSLKENLLKAAQNQIEERIAELKTLEAKIQTDLKKQDVLRQGQYNRLVKLYSSMKPKEAARIFDGLNMTILADMVRVMKVAASSQILAKMDPEKARKLTMILAKKETMVDVKSKKGPSELPKISSDNLAAENK